MIKEILFIDASFVLLLTSASTLRGQVKEATIIPIGLDIPMPDSACFTTSHTADTCQGATASDGTDCVWCIVNEPDVGACLSKSEASSAAQFLGLSCQKKSAALEIFLPDFNCFQAALDGDNAEVTCNESHANDGSPCVWCSVDGELAGACLSNSEASIANGQFGLSCPIDHLDLSKDNLMTEFQLPDVNCFKAAWVADNAEVACGKSKASDGSSCVWCSTQGDIAGACLSHSEASMATGQFGLSCPSTSSRDSVMAF